MFSADAWLVSDGKLRYISTAKDGLAMFDGFLSISQHIMLCWSSMLVLSCRLMLNFYKDQTNLK